MKEPRAGTVISLTRFRADLARSLSRRAEKLMEAPDLAAQVEALEPLEAYFLVKEVGLESALPILKCATPEQMQAFVDLDCWSDDRPDVEELDVWLATFASEGPEALAAAFGKIDVELQLWFLRAAFVIYDARDEEVPEPTSKDARRHSTTDSFFVLELIPGADRELDPFVLIDALYRDDAEDAYKLLVTARSELPTSLEEEALRFRTGRLEDMGFPTRSEALRLFTPPPAKPRPPLVAKGGGATTLPVPYATPLLDQTLLSRGLGALADAPLLEQLERDFLALVNLAVVAWGDKPRDVGHVGEIAARVRDTVSLGIEAVLSPERPMPEEERSAEATSQRAAAVLTGWSMHDLFRRGYQEVAPLHARARQLVLDPVITTWLAKSDEGAEYSEDAADRAFLRALATFPALLAGTDQVRTSRARAFATRGEVEAAGRRLEAIGARIG